MKKKVSPGKSEHPSVHDSRLTALVESGMVLASELSLDAVLQKIVDKALDVVGAQYAALVVVDPQGTLTQFRYSGMAPSIVRKIGSFPTGESLLGVLDDENEPLRLRDLLQHPESVGFPPHHPPMTSFLGLPIVARRGRPEGGTVVGRLYLTDKLDADEFTEEDGNLAQMLAAQAAVAIDNARMYEELQRFVANLEETVNERTGELAERNNMLERVNEDLTRLQRIHEAVVDCIPSSVLIFDRDLNLVFANPVFFQQWRHSRDVLGGNLRDLLPPDIVQKEGWEAKMRQVLKTGKPLSETDFRHCSAARGDTIVNYHLIRLTGKNRKEDKVILILDDVTEQAGLQRQLVQSEKLAAMGLLSAGVAHEIRTPLSVIRLAAYDVQDVLDDLARTLESDGEVRDAQRQLTLIERNVMDCNRVIENLLQFAREAKHEPSWLEVNSLLKGCLTLAEKDIALQSVAVDQRLEEAVYVFGGEDDLKQVFSNIVLNAVQSMPNGGTLTLATAIEDRHVAVSVSDTGCGIPEDIMDLIFDPFFTTKEPGKGTGLGLSICRKIIERMNGLINVTSTVGEGTTFVVRLPAEGGN